MKKHCAYGKQTDVALKASLLGQCHHFDGMSKLIACAGRGLQYKLPEKRKARDGNDSDESDSDEEKVEEKPFDPLCVWRSPWDEEGNGEAKGLPPQV